MRRPAAETTTSDWIWRALCGMSARFRALLRCINQAEQQTSLQFSLAQRLPTTRMQPLEQPQVPHLCTPDSMRNRLRPAHGAHVSVVACPAQAA
jgi:hypothetical protein